MQDIYQKLIQKSCNDSSNYVSSEVCCTIKLAHTHNKKKKISESRGNLCLVVINIVT